MISHVMVTQVIKCETCHKIVIYVMVIVIQSDNTKKVIKDSRTNDII